jgi:hypothetical protein
MSDITSISFACAPVMSSMNIIQWFTILATITYIAVAVLVGLLEYVGFALV